MPLTDRQLKGLYFPAWNAAAKAHGWHRKGLAPRFPHFGGPELNALYQRIWTIAEERSDRPSDSDWRHACHIVALGQDKSSSDFTNAELDRVLALFRLLADPDDLGATLAWNNPANEKRKRMLWWIRNNCVESYIVEICRQRFGTDDWESLDATELRQLHMTLKNRPAARKSQSTTGGPSAARPTFVDVSHRELVAAEHCEADPNDNDPF